jgi:hypothetical protein
MFNELFRLSLVGVVGGVPRGMRKFLGVPRNTIQRFARGSLPVNDTAYITPHVAKVRLCASGKILAHSSQLLPELITRVQSILSLFLMGGNSCSRAVSRNALLYRAKTLRRRSARPSG